MIAIIVKIAIYFAVFSVVMKIFDLPSIKKIKNAESVDAAIQFKKDLIEKRQKLWKYFVVLVLLFEIFLIVVQAANSGNDSIMLPIIMGMVSLGIFVVVLNKYIDYSNKTSEFLDGLSVEKVADYLKLNDHFVLYLRGFESDVYNKHKLKPGEFSEDLLSKVVQKGLRIQLCAIGMTKEVKCPLGGRRMYVEDATWEQEVFELMKRADKIVYRINDRPSCIWEIQKSKEVYEKCVFVVDDLEKYNNVRKELDGVVDLPPIQESSSEHDSRKFYFKSDNVIKEFDGEVSEYCEMLDLSADDVKKDDLKTDSVGTSFILQVVVFLVIIVTLILLLKRP